jgi:hypothetical protein
MTSHQRKTPQSGVRTRGLSPPDVAVDWCDSVLPVRSPTLVQVVHPASARGATNQHFKGCSCRLLFGGANQPCRRFRPPLHVGSPPPLLLRYQKRHHDAHLDPSQVDDAMKSVWHPKWCKSRMPVGKPPGFHVCCWKPAPGLAFSTATGPYVFLQSNFRFFRRRTS